MAQASAKLAKQRSCSALNASMSSTALSKLATVVLSTRESGSSIGTGATEGEEKEEDDDEEEEEEGREDDEVDLYASFSSSDPFNESFFAPMLLGCADLRRGRRGAPSPPPTDVSALPPPMSGALLKYFVLRRGRDGPRPPPEGTAAAAAGVGGISASVLYLDMSG